MHSVRVAEGLDRNTEGVEFHDVAMLDTHVGAGTTPDDSDTERGRPISGRYLGAPAGNARNSQGHIPEDVRDRRPE